MAEPKILSSREFLSLQYSPGLVFLAHVLDRQLTEITAFGEPLDLTTLEISVKRSDKEHMKDYLESYVRVRTVAVDG